MSTPADILSGPSDAEPAPTSQPSAHPSAHPSAQPSSQRDTAAGSHDPTPEDGDLTDEVLELLGEDFATAAPDRVSPVPRATEARKPNPPSPNTPTGPRSITIPRSTSPSTSSSVPTPSASTPPTNQTNKSTQTPPRTTVTTPSPTPPRTTTPSSIHYPADLPITARKDEILALLRQHQVIVLCGETGSGKSTQLPKMCLELAHQLDAESDQAHSRNPKPRSLIGHTQPRRIAARSLATRIAKELNTPLGTPGSLVGYKVRFTDNVADSARIKLMTDGVLLSEIRHDPLLKRYDIIIIDEAHERSLNIDFLLGYLKQILPRRPDLKLVITSATIDPERFSRHFADTDGRGAPIIEVSGRTYPVEVRWRPVEAEETDEEDPTVLEAIGTAVDELMTAGGRAGQPRDILVFLSGQREIRETAELLEKRKIDAEVLPLYAALSPEEQDRIFDPHTRRRIILATNVAETSLTVPGIHAVVDPGFARISRYHQRLRIQRLPIEPISQASARQRAGRCGRVADGVCIRLYSEEDFTKRDDFTAPEILRSNLAGVILQMKSMRLGDIEEFPFIDPPSPRMIESGYETLIEIGAVDDRRDLTPIGRALARLPVDPRLGRMILAAITEKCVDEVVVIVSALSVQDPRLRPMDKAEAADAAHAPFRDEYSDFITLLNLWETFQKAKAELSSNQLKKWCRERFLSYLRFREWMDVHRQLESITRVLQRTLEELPEGKSLPATNAPPKESGPKRKRRRRRKPQGKTTDPALHRDPGPQ